MSEILTFLPGVVHSLNHYCVCALTYCRCFVWLCGYKAVLHAVAHLPIWHCALRVFQFKASNIVWLRICKIPIIATHAVVQHLRIERFYVRRQRVIARSNRANYCAQAALKAFSCNYLYVIAYVGLRINFSLHVCGISYVFPCRASVRGQINGIAFSFSFFRQGPR